MKKSLLSILFVAVMSVSLNAQISFSTRVSASADDAEEAVGNGAMYDNSSDLEIVYDDFVTDDQLVGLRFLNVNIPQGAIILSASIQFEVDELKANDPCNLHVFLENSFTPATYGLTAFDISSRTYYTDSVAWNPPTWVAVNDQGPAQRTSDLRSLVQTHVNNMSWTSGGNMAFMIKGTGTRTAESYDGEPAAAPQLNIVYTMSTTTSAVRVSSSSDDAEEEVTTGAMYDNSSDLELVYDDFVLDNQLIGVRFQNVSIPQGAVITNAYIQFEVDELKANDPCNIKVYLENSFSPATYGLTAFDISSRTYYNDSVLWNPPTWVAVNDQGPAQQTADLTSLVQNHVNNSSWMNGGAMAFMIKGTGTRTAESYDGEPTAAPQLVVEYASLGGNFTLQLLHASDLEGSVDAIEDAPRFAAILDTLEGTYPNTLVISSGDNYISGPFFNAAKEPAIQDSLRNILGDFYGVPLNNLSTASGRLDISLMNVMGFDASCFGNHEFDLTTSAVASIVLASGNAAALSWMGAQFPYLSANLDFSASNLASASTKNVLPQADAITDLTNSAAANATKKIAPATVITRNGEQIGVIGATTQLLSTISSPGAVTVVGAPGSNDMAQLATVLQPYIDSLSTMGVNKIIVTSHLQQFALEQQLAGLLSNVDIIIAGGSDFLLADGSDVLRAGDVAMGTYPYQTVNADGDPVMIVSTDGQYSYVGRLVVDFDANGILVPSSLDTMISGAYATLPGVVSNLYGSANPFAAGTKGYFAERLTNSIKDIVVAKDGNAFGKTNFFLEGRRGFVRTEETNLGNITADANLWIARKYDPTVAVSLKNGGGIRAEIGVIDQLNAQLLPPQANPVAGKDSLEVSQLDIEAALSFNNGLKVVETTPSGLKALLEHGISNWDGVSTNGQMPQIGGMEFSFDPTAAAGSRIANLAIVDENHNAIDSVVVNGMVHGDPNRVIKMVSLNFLVDNDGDGYPFSIETTNGVDLDVNNVNFTAQVAFAAVGSEQNALAEYLLAEFSVDPFDMEDTDPSLDERIQILSLRGDSVLNTNAIGLEEYAMGNLSVYPNPAADVVYIEIGGGVVLEHVALYSLAGQKMLEVANISAAQTELNLAGLSAGSYVLTVSSGKTTRSFKLMISK